MYCSLQFVVDIDRIRVYSIFTFFSLGLAHQEFSALEYLYQVTELCDVSDAWPENWKTFKVGPKTSNKS